MPLDTIVAAIVAAAAEVILIDCSSDSLERSPSLIFFAGIDYVVFIPCIRERIFIAGSPIFGGMDNVVSIPRICIAVSPILFGTRR